MEKLPTIDIKGKEYVMVKDRLVYFNENYAGSITTEVIKNDQTSVVVKATVTIPATNGSEIGRPEQVFTGHSEAYRKGNMGDVPVEVAETSAVGRALAMMGIGIIDSVASADEIRKSDDRPSYVKKSANLDTNVDPRVPIVNEDTPVGDFALICSCGKKKKRNQVKKEGPNKGRYFWSCPKPMNEQCPNSFTWDDVGDEPLNIEGEKAIDYNPTTGELLP